jgi:hypothetical protein
MLALVPKNVAGNNQRCIGRIVAEAEAGNDVGPDETRLMSASDAFESPGIDIAGIERGGNHDIYRLYFNMDTKNPNVKSRTTPEFAQYQRENFWASNDGVVPPFNTGRSSAWTPMRSADELQIPGN